MRMYHPLTETEVPAKKKSQNRWPSAQVWCYQVELNLWRSFHPLRSRVVMHLWRGRKAAAACTTTCSVRTTTFPMRRKSKEGTPRVRQSRMKLNKPVRDVHIFTNNVTISVNKITHFIIKIPNLLLFRTC